MQKFSLKKLENVISYTCRMLLLNSRVFTESCTFFQRFFKLYCSFDAPFGSILKKYRSFATLHYSVVANSAVFAVLKQFKAICPGNRHTHWQTIVPSLCANLIKLWWFYNYNLVCHLYWSYCNNKTTWVCLNDSQPQKPLLTQFCNITK